MLLEAGGAAHQRAVLLQQCAGIELSLGGVLDGELPLSESGAMGMGALSGAAGMQPAQRKVVSEPITATVPGTRHRPTRFTHPPLVHPIAYPPRAAGPLGSRAS